MINHAFSNLSHQLIHSNHFKGTQQSTFPLVGFDSPVSLLSYECRLTQFKDLTFPKRIGLPPHKSFHSLISPPGSSPVLSFPQSMGNNVGSHEASILPAAYCLVSFTQRSETVSSGTLPGVPGMALKLGRSWYFVCTEPLPKTKCFLTSVYSEIRACCMCYTHTASS